MPASPRRARRGARIVNQGDDRAREHVSVEIGQHERAPVEQIGSVSLPLVVTTGTPWAMAAITVVRRVVMPSLNGARSTSID